ncbi:hypothetical protein BV25DRAFT_1986285 [Artomyces pyxidatus]|uniref:Uncharacterized protein n=1 Tax=Artomyces pyxidatus TaxID=48021 RepID=A0ACB8TJR6_9AGAM|nr:hypothetical protein BV25DRAFT_1986285 [Artomyces pyxidatus]
MDSFPSKRIYTEDERAMSDASFTTSATGLVSSDLTAQLQNVGSRIRRSVSQGYATDRFTSAPSSARVMTRTSSTPFSPVVDESPFFRSSNDTLHAVFSQFPSATGASRELKRPRAGPTIDEEADGGSADVDMPTEVDEHGDALVNTSEAGEPIASLRPMKPLRRTPRTFGQTQSLPATIFGPSSVGINVPNEATAFQKAGIMEEEDWSAPDFSGAFPTARVETLLNPPL